MTSTTDLNKINDNRPTYINTSPSKSIMKKTPTASPKKVAFTATNPEVHHYPDNADVSEEKTSSNDNTATPKIFPIQHKWKAPDFNYSDDDNSASIPPTPPPHTSTQSFAQLINEHAQRDEEQGTLSQLNVRHDNLSLDEKINSYLGHHENSNVTELDTHLQDLQEASKHKTESNIYDLSLSIKSGKPDMENPLNSLSNPDTQLRSSGSSQSSLQSLRDNNRTLESVPGSPTKSNRGLSVNDGLKGLSDDIVESLLPRDESDRMLSMKALPTKKTQVSSDDQLDSFDRSYTNTEQSILNLLVSASHSQLSLHQEDPKIKKEPGLTTTTDKEIIVKNQPVMEEPIKVKQEYDPFIKQEQSVHVSTITGLTPKEEVDQYNQEHGIEEQEEEPSDITNGSTRMSIQFHVDSQWKLEDSNDGDREDNDEFSRMEKSEILHDVAQSSTDSIDYRDASSELLSKVSLSKTLAPPRAEEVEVKQEPEQEQEEVTKDSLNDNILANSSNIMPQEEITLPPVEQNDYSSFNELTKNMDSYSTFEESLSAEHDLDTKPVPTQQIIADYQKYKQETEEKRKSSTDNVKIPPTLQSRKFKEVNVMSRRVVSPDMFDLQVSEFLPELSQDSGFEGLNFANYTQNQNKGRNITPLSTQNVLSNIDNDPTIVEPPQPKSYSEIRQARRLSSGNRLHVQQPVQHQQQPQHQETIPFSTKRKSRFRVPTFEIRRTSSALSPRDMYNDIFDDFGSGKPTAPPTIKAEGMRTLPSMDKDDVKRILSAKKGMTQEEYTNAKFVDQEVHPKKNSIVNNPELKYEELQQSASIHNATFDSSPSGQNSENNTILPYFADELRKPPSAFLSANQLFNEQDSYPTRQSSVLIRPSANNSSVLPEPDFELINSPEKRPNVVTGSGYTSISGSASSSPLETIGGGSPASSSPNDDLNIHKDELGDVLVNVPDRPSTPKLQQQQQQVTSPKKSPIKIGSPMKVVKKNDNPIQPARKSFDGDEIVNQKLRDGPLSPVDDDEQHKPSTVSVPSEYTDAASTQQPQPHQESHHHHKKYVTDEDAIQEDKLEERGKLFFRVLGFKNINLPDIKDHNGKLSLTLDNGVHSVTTPYYIMDNHKVAIGKEFELTVGDSLEFILTMKLSYEKPRGKLVEVTERKVVKSKKRLSRIFGSKDIITTTKFVPTEAKDSWAGKFAQDGSFARCYIDLQQFEDKITGKALQFDLNCFNEWETINGGVQKRKPYNIGQLEVKMLFVPRSDPREVLPTSIRTAYESIDELNEELHTTHEGYLHQEGGDCPIYKRRFFKLQGTSLLAHNETTHKTRAKINLSKVVDIIFVDKENINRSNYRNFSDVLLVENSFKIKFANGELIDFCAANKKEMNQWIDILESIVYRNRFRRQPWVNLMLKENNYV
ncbi:BUD4 Bud site selection protein BUD4 [Candida maltosa Xu316]